MKHYGVGEWVDFARGLTPVAEGEAMGAHLRVGCPECQELADFCAKLHTVCREMSASSVPEWIVRNALAICPAQRAKPRTRAFRLPVELVYDSFLAPAPAGLRTAWQRGWQALYRAGDCSLDLRIEPEMHSSRAALIGQISNHALPKNRMEGLPVCVKQGRMVVAETRSNEFGEFQMEYEQRGRLQLCVNLENGSKRFQVPLRKLAVADPAAGTDRVGLPEPADKPGPETE